MNMEHLHTFLIVSSCGNFSEAAKILFVPQPTISNRIQFLEEELGKKLFIRGKRGVTLTESGELFLPYANKVVDTISSATSALNTSPKDNSLKIGSTIPFTYPLILNKMKQLSLKYTDLNIFLRNIEHKFILDKLSTREIDTAFVVEPFSQKGIECHKIGKEEMELVLSPQHPLANKKLSIELSDLENENLICYEPYYETINSQILIHMKRKGRLVTSQIGVVKQLITQNSGMAILPPLSAKPELDRGQLISIPLNLNMDTIYYYLVFRQNERYYEDILLA